MFNNTNVLVTGGTGFIGMNLIQRLRSLGAYVRTTLHKKAALLSDKKIEYVWADLTSSEDCQKVVKDIDYVFMCAAVTSGAAVMTSTPLAHVTPNVVMNTQMLDAAYRAKVKKVLFISSSAAYPPTEDRPVSEDEMFLGDPDPVYYSVGWMKRYTEILCKTYALKIKDPMSTVVVRPSNIYGPFDKFDPQTSHVTASLIRRVIERQDPFIVWGTGNEIRDLIYIDDFLDGMILAFEKSNNFMEINIASGNGYTIKQILEILLEAENMTNIKVQFDSSKPNTISKRFISTNLAKKDLNFEAQTTLKQGLENTISWYRENRFTWIN